MSVAEYSVYGEIVAGSKILVAEYPSKPGGCGIWYKLPNGNTTCSGANRSVNYDHICPFQKKGLMSI